VSEAGLFLGTAGWSYADWQGVVYPAGREKPKDPLAFLARYFSCVEVNSTFYRIPDPRTVAGWVTRTAHHAPPFLFSVKIWRGFTHEKEAEIDPQRIREFRDALEPLSDAGRLAAVLVQFPWYFERNRQGLSRLHRLAEAFGGLPLVLEVRHDSWTQPTALEKIASIGFSFCNIDLPLAKNSIPPASIVTGPIGYVRLHGRNAAAWFDPKAGRDAKYDYLYDSDELDQWVGLISEISNEVNQTIVITNNHYKGQAAVNALELKSLLRKTKVDVPEPLARAFPRLQRLSRNQDFLFDL